MKNAWLKRHLKRQYFTMPTTLNQDRELEYEPIRGHQIPKLIEFWRHHYKAGSITRQEYAAIAGLILYAYERQSGINCDADTLD